MKKQENPSRPAFMTMLSALIVGMGAFVVWLLRQGPESKSKKSPAALPTSQPQVATMGGEPKPAEKTPSVEQKSATSTVAPLRESQALPGEAPSSLAPGNVAITAPAKPGVDQVAEPVAVESTAWSTTTRYLAGIGIFLFIIWLINFSQQTLTLLIFAMLIAILIQPVRRFMQRRLRFSRGLAIVITYLLAALLIFILPLLIVPSIISGVNDLINYDWQGLLDTISGNLEQQAALTSSIPVVGAGISDLLTTLSQFTQSLLSSNPQQMAIDVTTTELLDGLGRTIGFLGNLVGPLISSIISIVFMLLISMQISLAGGQIRGWIISPVPQRFKEEIRVMLDRIQLVWVSFLHGQFALMVVMGLLTWLLNVILGTPQALLLGVLAGLLEVVPSLGPILATIPAAIFALMFGSMHFPGLNPWIFMLVVIIGYVLLQGVENQLLVPRILGSAVDLPPLIVLVGVTIAGAKAGIVGVFLATPMIASGREILTYVYEKIIAAPELGPPQEDQPSIIDQIRGFVGRIRLPSLRRRQPVEEATPGVESVS